MWLFGGGKKPDEPQLTPHQAQRQKQIDSIRQQHSKLIEVVRDESYKIPFNVGAQTFFLDIKLSSIFPRDPPSLKLTPRGTHAWVDSSGNINSPKLTTFNMHSDLGKILTEIIEEFQRNPPLMPRDFTPAESTPGASSSVYPSFNLPAGSVPPIPIRSDSPGTTFAPGNRIKSIAQPLWSSVSDNFPEVNTMSNDELQALLDNSEDQALVDKITSAPVIASLRDEVKRLTELNHSIATENLARKPFLEQKKAAVLDKYSTAGEKRKEFDDLQRELEGLMRRHDPAVIQQKVRQAGAEAEAESEAIADDFVAGKMDVDSFLSKFLEKRKTVNLRKATDDVFGRQLSRTSASYF
ncbi:hypothetical protein RvY_17711-2 [Ramazzottius varieornatus]|uniref:VPS37 C-terminal domain-containing protein n=1 Tax=Ramazzottius varieornatus TaxID=947166 RepID=A0A1D1W3S7_RAMVA|nr:hypothetical protein RvY_17711-2 [Ramazzottius varieornatus]